MTSLIKNVNPAFSQCLDKGRLGLIRRLISLEGVQQAFLRLAEGETLHVGRPFVQHELRGSLDARYRDPLSDLRRLDNDRLSPPDLRHGFAPPAGELAGLAIVPGRAA